MLDFRFKPLEILDALQTHRARYVLIGGLAAAALGSPSITDDVDICPEGSQKNLAVLAGVLTELGAQPNEANGNVPFGLDERRLGEGDRFTFVTRLGGLDVVSLPPGSNGYEELKANAVDIDLGLADTR